jgi:hypothetical protein
LLWEEANEAAAAAAILWRKPRLGAFMPLF